MFETGNRTRRDYIESGEQFQILTIRLEREFLSSSNTARNLANLCELPRVEEQCDRVTNPYRSKNV